MASKNKQSEASKGQSTRNIWSAGIPWDGNSEGLAERNRSTSRKPTKRSEPSGGLPQIPIRSVLVMIVPSISEDNLSRNREGFVLGIPSEESRSPLRPDNPEVCPYCGRRPTGVGVDVYSDDHIFMYAIGGKKTVRVCKRCNDRCGGTFEARNLKETIIRLSILLAKAGVPIAKKGLKWKNAFSTLDGQVYNLVLTADGVRTESCLLRVEFQKL